MPSHVGALCADIHERRQSGELERQSGRDRGGSKQQPVPFPRLAIGKGREDFQRATAEVIHARQIEDDERGSAGDELTHRHLELSHRGMAEAAFK